MNSVIVQFNKMQYSVNSKVMRQNSNTPYKGNFIDKQKIIDILDSKFYNAMQADSTPYGPKNLVYTSVYGVNYAMLLELLLTTILKNNKNINFDLLFITDSLTLKIIKSIDSLKYFNWDFHLTPTPEDGVECSMLKTRIFDYKNIEQYGKVLFLDTDIICKGNITNFFDYQLTDNIEVVTSPLLVRIKEFESIYKNVPCSASITHGLGFFTEKIKKIILEKDPKVFNAGQFLFKNNRQMRIHFENINWLMSVWPSVYFFEQSFMNHYFVMNEITSYDILEKNVCVTVSVSDLRTINLTNNIFIKQHMDTHSLVHFAGTTLDGRNKFMFIKHYCNNHNICL